MSIISELILLRNDLRGHLKYTIEYNRETNRPWTRTRIGFTLCYSLHIMSVCSFISLHCLRIFSWNPFFRIYWKKMFLLDDFNSYLRDVKRRKKNSIRAYIATDMLETRHILANGKLRSSHFIFHEHYCQHGTNSLLTLDGQVSSCLASFCFTTSAFLRHHLRRRGLLKLHRRISPTNIFASKTLLYKRVLRNRWNKATERYKRYKLPTFTIFSQLASVWFHSTAIII